MATLEQSFASLDDKMNKVVEFFSTYETMLTGGAQAVASRQAGKSGL
jgi:hypothetical protein